MVVAGGGVGNRPTQEEVVYYWLHIFLKINHKQESIPVGRLPPTCQQYIWWRPPLGVTTPSGIPAP